MCIEFSLLCPPSVRIWLSKAVLSQAHQSRNENLKSSVNYISDFLKGISHRLKKQKTIVRIVVRGYHVRFSKIIEAILILGGARWVVKMPAIIEFRGYLFTCEIVLDPFFALFVEVHCVFNRNGPSSLTGPSSFLTCCHVNVHMEGPSLRLVSSRPRSFRNLWRLSDDFRTCCGL